MATIVGSASIRIFPNTTGFNSALQSQLKGANSAIQGSLGNGGAGGTITALRGNLRGLSEDLGRSSQRMINAGEGMTYALTRPLVGLLKTIGETATEYDKSLRTASAVSAAYTGNSIEQLAAFNAEAATTYERLSGKAKEFSLTTSFSMNEVANAFVEVSRAGIQGEDKITGVFETIANVAMVEGADITKVTEGLIKVFTGFGGSFEKLGPDVKGIFGEVRGNVGDLQAEFEKMGDVLSIVSARTTTNISDLVNAFRYAGPVAAAVGLSFEETASGLGLLAQAGFDATIGGTALRGIITRLIIPTKVNQEVFDKLGVTVNDVAREIEGEGDTVEEITAIHKKFGLEVLDASGKMKPLSEILGYLDEKGITTAEAMKLFGQRAGPGLLALIGQSPELIDSMTKEMENAGGATKAMADILKGSWDFQFKQFRNSLGEFANAVAASGLMDFIIGVTLGLTEFMRNLGETSPEVFNIALVVGGLVAAIGPLNIVLGLLGKAWVVGLIKPMILLTHPIGAVVVAIAAIAAAVGFAASRSEELRTALGHLFGSLSVAVLPILHVLKTVISGIGDGVGELGKMFGDWLAPKIRDMAEAINGWVTRSGMDTFIGWFYDGLRSLASAAVDVKQRFDEFTESDDFENLTERVAAGFESLGQAVEYVEKNFDKFREQFVTALELFGKVGAILGGAVYVGLITVGALFEQLAKVAKPLVEFLGNGGLAGVLLLLGARFLTFGGQAVTGITLGTSAIAMMVSPGITGKLVGTGIVLDAFGRKLQLVGTAGTVTAGYFLALGARLQGLGGSLFAMGASLDVAMEKLMVFGRAAIATLQQGVGPALMGFFAGQLAQNADTLSEKITAVGMAISGMMMAIATGNPYVIILTSITMALGAFLKEGEGIPNMTINASSALDNLVGTLQDLDGQLTSSAVLKDFIEEIDKFDPKGFQAIAESLHQTGLSVEDMGKAFAGGSEEGTKFMDEFKRRFVDENLTGELKNFRIEAEKFSKPGVLGGREQEWEQVLGIDAIEKAQLGLDGYAGRFRVMAQNAEGQWEPIKEHLTEVSEITQTIGEGFDTTFGGNAGKDFANKIDVARQKYELIKPVLDEIQNAQANTAEGAKTWVENAQDANSKLGESKRLLDLMSGAGLADPRQAFENLVLSLRSGAEELKLAGSTDFKLKDSVDEMSIAANKQVREISDKYRQYVTETLAGVPLGVDEAATAKSIEDALFAARLGVAGQIAAIMGDGSEEGILKAFNDLGSSELKIDAGMVISKAQVTEMVIEQLKVKDPGKAALYEGGSAEATSVGFSLDIQDTAGTFAKAGIMPLDFVNFILKGGTAFKDVAVKAINAKSNDPSVQAALISFLAGPQFQSKEIQTQFSSVMGALPEGWTPEMVLTNLTGGGTVTQMYTDLVVRPLLFGMPGMTPERSLAFINAINAGLPFNVQAYLDILPNVSIPAGMDPTLAADLIALFQNSGQDVNKNLQVAGEYLAKGTPEEQSAMAKLLSDNALPITYLPVAIQLQNGLGIDLLKKNRDELELMLAFAMAPSFHDGGIVGPGGHQQLIAEVQPHEMFAILEIGEAVIPKGVVDALGQDFFRQLIAGTVPTALLGVEIALSVRLLGGDVVAAGFQVMMAIVSGLIAGAYASMISLFAAAGDAFNSTLARMSGSFGSFRAIMAVGSMLIVGNINSIGTALERIPVIMSSVSRSIANGFRNPIAFIGASVWPPFATLLNAASKAFGIEGTIPSGFTIPSFHSGGVVGQDGGSYGGGALSNDELFALLQKGEGVMTREMMASMTNSQLSEFRRGNPMWHAVGDPFESGKSYVSSNKDKVGESIKEHDLGAMKAAYNDTVLPLVKVLKAQFSGNLSAEIGASAIDRVADGAFDWVRGGNEAVSAEMRSRMAAVGLPPGFNLEGAVPEGFDIGHWRGFLGANKRPGSYPLLISYLQAAGVPHLVNSTFRPGGTSYHAQSRAVDFGAPNDSNYDSPGLLRINHALAPMLGVLQELIYSGPGGISDKAYDGATMAAHHNHVHAALANGAYIQDKMFAMLGEAGPEVVLPLSDPGRALDIAIASDLFSVLEAGKRSRMGSLNYEAPSSSQTALRSVPANQSVPAGSSDGGFLGGGPGNTYNIYGIDEAHVRTTIRNQDEAVQRKRF